MKSHVAIYVAPVFEERELISWRFEVVRDNRLVATGNDFPSPELARIAGQNKAIVMSDTEEE